MKCYAVALIDITDRAWTRQYVEKVTPMVEAAGGRYLARTTRIEKVEGAADAPQLFLIIEWPSMQAAQDFYNSDAYRPYLDSRLNGSRGNFFFVAGEDANKVARVSS